MPYSSRDGYSAFLVVVLTRFLNLDVGVKLCPGAGGPARYLQLHLHQEDSVMVGEDLVYSLFATPLIVFGALSGLWPLASGLWPLAKGG